MRPMPSHCSKYNNCKSECPIDNKRLDFRRYTAKAFEINHEILDLLDKPVESPKKSKATLPK